MLEIGMDLVALAIVGLLCVLLTAVWCGVAGMPEEEGDAAVVSSFTTMFVMLAGYAVIARVLDALALSM